MHHSRTSLLAVVVLLLALGTTACSTFHELTNTEKGAAAGAGGGAVLGGAVGKATGLGTARGAIMGAVVGGTAGAIIGQRMDRQAEELEDDLPNAEIERVGEGIQVTFDSGILFDFDATSLRPEAQNNLQDLAASLEEYPDTEVLIVGHTDSVGRPGYNQGLSERRASSAASHLMEHGVSADRINTVGRGEEEPVASNDTDNGRQQNRRVEVAIYASEEYREEIKAQH